MKTTTEIKALYARYDKIIYYLIRGAAVVILLDFIAKFVLNVDKITFAIVLLSCMLVCFGAMIARNIMTGKRYATGAKKRRKRILPFFYDKKKRARAKKIAALKEEKLA